MIQLAPVRCPLCGALVQSATIFGVVMFACLCVPPNRAIAIDMSRLRSTVQPTVNPLDVEYDGVNLGWLLERDRNLQREAGGWFGVFTPAQRAAISAHWIVELRAEVKASVERDRNRVLVDLQDEP